MRMLRWRNVPGFFFKWRRIMVTPALGSEKLLSGGDAGYPEASGIENGDVITVSVAWVASLPA